MKKWLCGLALWLVVFSVLAEESKPGIDPKADEVVKKMCRAYRDLKSYEGTCDTEINMTIGEETQTNNFRTRTIFSRPNKVFLVNNKVRCISDGDILWTYMPDSNKCIKQNAPDKITYRDVSLAGAGNPSLELMFSEDAYKGFMSNIKSLKLGKPEKIADREMIILEIEGKPDQGEGLDKFTSKAWIGKEDYLLYHMTGELSGIIPANQSQTGKETILKGTTEIIYVHERINKKIRDSVFTFEPPKGTELIDNYKEDRVDEKTKIAKADIRLISTMLDLYELDHGFYPTTEQGLQALMKKPTTPPIPPEWNGPYLKHMPIDPWQKPYKYCCPGTHNNDFDLYSCGPDGIEGNEDDIVNWE